jgi:RNA polymerase sigma-70 factor (sigma-E family)
MEPRDLLIRRGPAPGTGLLLVDRVTMAGMTGRCERMRWRPASIPAVPPRPVPRAGKAIPVLTRISGVEHKRQEFTEFYASARDDCLRIVLVSVGDRQLAEDLVAEAFTRAWMSWRKVRDHPSPRAWVVRTAMNANVSWWRRRRREVLADDASGPSAPPADSPAGLDEVLVRAIRTLPRRQREVITLRMFFDLDTETTARTLGISPGTVGAHLHRALAALRAQIPSLSDQEANR